MPLTTFELHIIYYAETSSHHFTIYTVEHRFSFDTPEPSIHYSPENTGYEECFIHGIIILYLHKIFTSNIDSEAAATVTLAWSLGLSVLIFCNIMLLLICCVLYWKMKGIEGKIKFHIVHAFCFSICIIIISVYTNRPQSTEQLREISTKHTPQNVTMK